MWQGIKLQNGANAEIINDSWIRDADIGLNIINNSKVKNIAIYVYRLCAWCV
nr:hypothetical protein [Bacteroidota bacterium]